MTLKEIQELIKTLNRSNLTELKLKDGEFELAIRTDKYQRKSNTEQVIVSAPAAQPVIAAPAVAPAPAPAAAAPQADLPPATPAAEADNNANLLEIKSPIVGTFYRSSSPDKPPYVKVGDVIEKGSVVCIIEAMKLFNEIESDLGGKIVKVMVEDAQPVEYDQVLFLVEPA